MKHSTEDLLFITGDKQIGIGIFHDVHETDKQRISNSQ